MVGQFDGRLSGCAQRSQIGILAATQSIVVGGIEIDRVPSYSSDASR